MATTLETALFFSYFILIAAFLILYYRSIINFLSNSYFIELKFLNKNYGGTSKWIKNPGDGAMVEFQEGLYELGIGYYYANTKHYFFSTNNTKSQDLTALKEIKKSIDVNSEESKLTAHQVNRKLKIALAKMFEDSAMEQIKFYLILGAAIFAAIAAISSFHNGQNIEKLPPLIESVKNTTVQYIMPYGG